MVIVVKMASLKPNKPELFTGKRDAVTVAAWLYQVDTYLNLLQVSNPGMNLDEAVRVSYASTLLKGNAAHWWYMLVQSGQTPGTWEAFCNMVRTEFVPSDSVDRARDKLRALRQKTSVNAYLNEFRNIVISIPGISNDEKLDKFVSGLKPEVLLEVRKNRPDNLEAAAQIALTIDSALFSMNRYYQSNVGSGSASGPVPMEIGNVEGTAHYRGKSFKPNGRGGNLIKQRTKDIRNGLCFVCHKPGCRSWKHKNGDDEIRGNNVRATSSGSEFESEN